jgi:hypothetical protein
MPAGEKAGVTRRDERAERGAEGVGARGGTGTTVGDMPMLRRRGSKTGPSLDLAANVLVRGGENLLRGVPKVC